MTEQVSWPPAFPGWPGNSLETTHDPDADVAQNQPAPKIYHFRMAEYGHRRAFQIGLPPCYQRSSPRRPSCAAAMAKGLPVRTAASNNTNTGNHHLRLVRHQFAGA